MSSLQSFDAVAKTGRAGVAPLPGVLQLRSVGDARALGRPVALLAVYAAAYWLAYRFGMTFSHAAASPFWFPGSVLLCALVRTRPRLWWIFLATALPIRLFSEVSAGIPLWFLLATFAVDAATGVLSAAALRRYLSDPTRLDTLQDVLLYGLLVVVLVPGLLAFAGAAARTGLGFDFRASWEEWYLGNALAHLVVTPALFYWLFDRRTLAPLDTAKVRAEAMVLAVGLGLASWAAFHAAPAALMSPWLFLPTPFLVWAAIRFGMRGATGAIFVFAVFAVAAAVSGVGPFADEAPYSTALILQGFFAPRAAMLYLVAVLVQQVRSTRDVLRESEQSFRTMADTTPVMIWMTGRDRLISFVNQSWLEFTGSTREAQIGQSWTRHVHLDDLTRCLLFEDDSTEQRSEVGLELRMLRPDGEYRLMQCTIVPRFAGDGSFLGLLGTCVDVTARKQAELEKRRHLEELAHASRLVTMGAFAASVTHELRQPLTAIRQNASVAAFLLDKSPAPVPELKETLADIRADEKRAALILDQMRQLIEKREVALQPVDAGELVSDVCRLMGIEASERHVTMSLELAPDLPRIAGDRVHLHQVLMNVMLNAFDAMSHVAEPMRSLVVRTERGERDTVDISVVDSGPGIADDDLHRLFDPFWTTKQKGIGVGLAISRTIVEAHGGRIWAENGADGGAVFRIRLPTVGSPAA